MKLFVIAALIAVATAGRLDHLERSYLPPDNSGSFGSQGFRSAPQGSLDNSPFGSGAGRNFNGATSNQYLPPNQSSMNNGFGSQNSFGDLGRSSFGNRFGASSFASQRNSGALAATSNKYLPPNFGAAGSNGQQFGRSNQGFSGQQYSAPSSRYGTPASNSFAQARYQPQSQYSAPSTQYGAPTNQYSAPSTRYGAPTNQYSAPSTRYGAPSNQYSAPSTQYGAPNARNSAPSTQYDTPSTQYGTPSTQYGTPSNQYSAPSTQYGAPNARNSAPSTQYGTPSNQYSALSSQYGAPNARFSTPSTQYGAPAARFSAPSTQYGAPSAYSAPSSSSLSRFQPQPVAASREYLPPSQTPQQSFDEETGYQY